MHVPLKKAYTREKSLHIISMFSGTPQGTVRSARVPLKKAYTREKSLHIISMFSGTVQGTDRNAHVPLKTLIQKKNPYILL